MIQIFLIPINFLVHTDTLIYSTSVVDAATTDCFLEV